MKLLLAVSAAGIVLAGHPSSAQTPLAEVPFVLHQNAIIVRAAVNDRDTLSLLLDTGWGPMALTDSAIARLNSGKSEIAVSKIAVSNGRATMRSIAVGAFRQAGVTVEIFKAADLTPLIGPHDGVLSTAFFHDVVLQIDYPRSTLRFFARSPIADRHGADGARRSALPMTFSRNAGWLPFTDSVFVNGRAARGLFDTGGSGAFVAMEKLTRAERLDQSLDSTRARMGYLDGSPRQAPVRIARLQRVQLGQFVVDTPRVVLAPPGLEGGDWGHDLVIGYGFMRRYIVTFDYPGRTITLELVATP